MKTWLKVIICLGIVFFVGIFGMFTLAQDSETSIAKDHNYIQSAHNEINFRLRGTSNEFVIENVDTYGDLTGKSMQPTIYTGNTLIEINYIGQELKEGQIIRFKSGEEKYTVHRIKAIYEDYLLTQGDNNNNWEKIYYENVTDIVIGVLYT